jgi:hypothetical protein
MRVLNKLIYTNSYTIPTDSTQEIYIPETLFNEYIINKETNVQYIIYFSTNHFNFTILNIKRVILINQFRGRNNFFHSLLNFDFIKENNSIFLKDIKEKMYRIYIPSIFDISKPPEFLIMTIQNTDTLNNLDIYLELRELNAILL